MGKLVDNEKAYRTLSIWSDGGRLPHAVLIEGEKGSGRKTFATELAGVILCEGEHRPCGLCRHCRKVEKGIHPDISEYGGGNGARSFHIDTVREIRAAAQIRPNEADSRVFILRDVQNMSAQAQNALLKTIEEPAKGVHFILTCVNREQMLPTILSRVAVVSLKVPEFQQCIELLRSLVPEHDASQYEAAALEAGGNVGIALFLLQSGEESTYTKARETLRQLLQGKELEALSSLQVFERDREGFVSYLSLMRAAAMSAEKDRGYPAISPLQLMKIIAIMDETTAALGFNANMLLLTTALCSKIRTVVAGV